MKNWKSILLIAGVLLLVSAFAAYAARIASCYPAANILAQYSPEYLKGFRESCRLRFPADHPIQRFPIAIHTGNNPVLGLLAVDTAQGQEPARRSIERIPVGRDV